MPDEQASQDIFVANAFSGHEQDMIGGRGGNLA